MHGLCLYFGLTLAALLCGLVQANFKYNVSLAEMATCRHYYIPMNRGYSYADFFHVNHLDNNKLAANERLHLKFYVMTARDAHILLASTDYPRSLDRVYEIVIGAGRNSFSTIRINMGRRRVATNQTANILSMLDPTPIEVVQTKDDVLKVFVGDDKQEPLMTYSDAMPLQVNYISFTTYDSIPARWFYDCQFDGSAAELEEEQRPQTPMQLLTANLTAKAENASFPLDLMMVDFSFQISSVSYQHDRGMMQTRLSVQLKWMDKRLAWNPEDFGQLYVLEYRSRDIWLPELKIINAAMPTKSIWDSEHHIRIRHNGTLYLILNDIFVHSWCPSPNANWPSERLNCDVILGLDHSGILESPLLYHDEGVHEPIEALSEWKVHTIGISPVANGNEARYTDEQILQSMNGDIAIEIEISRNSRFYRNVFSMPILACQILLILSFLLRGYRRGALILIVVVVLVLGLMFIAKHAPKSYTPNIMSAYQHILRIATFCYMWHIWLMWLEMYPPKSKPCDWLTKITNFSALRVILCLRLIDSNDFVSAQQHPWRQVAKVLNAICFVITNIIFLLIVTFLLPHA